MERNIIYTFYSFVQESSWPSLWRNSSKYYLHFIFVCPGIFGGLLWLVSLFLHTAFDFMSARKSYGDAWVSIQILLFMNLVMCTYSARMKIVPWLEMSVFQLDKENSYLKTFARIRKVFRVSYWLFRNYKGYFYHLTVILSSSLPTTKNNNEATIITTQ